MVFELDLANETEDFRMNAHTAKGALEDTRLKENATITMSLQHGFQVSVRGLSRGAGT